MEFEKIAVLRRRLNVGIMDARRALADTGGDVEAAAALLRAGCIDQLVTRTGASAELCTREFDLTDGDVERAVVRLRYLTRPEPPSAARRRIDTAVDDDAAARDLHAILGGCDGIGTAPDVVYLAADLWIRVQADGLHEYLDAEPPANWSNTAAALRAVGCTETAHIFERACRSPTDIEALDRLDSRWYACDEDVGALVMRTPACTATHSDPETAGWGLEWCSGRFR